MFKFLMLLAFVQAAFVPEETEAMKYGTFQRHLRGKLTHYFGYKAAHFSLKYTSVRLGYWRIYKHYGLKKLHLFMFWQKRTAAWWKHRKTAWSYYKRHGWTRFWKVYHVSASRSYYGKGMWKTALWAAKYVAKW